MPFKNDQQRRAACWVLMRTLARDDLWPPTGPTKEALRIRDARGDELPRQERVALLVAFAFWDGDEQIRLSELEHLPPATRFAVGSLLASLAADEMLPGSVKPYVDQWIADERVSAL